MTLDDMLREEPEKVRPAKPPRRRGFAAVTVIGLVLMLGGLGALGWVGYQYFGTNVVSERQFDKTRQDLRRLWDNPPPPPSKSAQSSKSSKSAQSSKSAPSSKTSPKSRTAPTAGPAGAGDNVGRAVDGDAIALLRVPAWGQDYEVPILKGTSLDILSKGVGMYDSSVAPGEVGNFALAGHRITHGQPFSRLLELKPGDEVVVETRTKIFTYVMDSSPAALTVTDTASWVLDAVPGKPETKPARALMTLTTCQDLFHSPDRSVGFAHLDSTVNK